MRYFIGFLIILGLIILGIILFIRLLFGGGGQPEVSNTEALTSYAQTSTVMQLEISGPINANQDHRRVQIDVGTGGNEIRIYKGYQTELLRRENFHSNPDAYASFLRAIDLLGYTSGDTAENMADERGFCPTGERYVFSIVSGSETKQRFWSTSCGDQGSFKGQTDMIIELFQAQIPGYEDIADDLGF